MKTLAQWIEQAHQLGATQLRMVSQKLPEIRLNKGWQTFGESPVAPQWLREQVRTLADSAMAGSAASDLSQGGVLRGELRGIDGANYVATLCDQGYYLLIHLEQNLLQPLQIADYNLPPLYLQSLQKNPGLYVICGAQRSGKSRLAAALADDLCQKGLGVAAFADTPLSLKELSAVNFHSSRLVQAEALTSGFDVIVIDSLLPGSWRQGLLLAEQGLRVIMTSPQAELRTACLRLGEKVSSENGLARLTASLQSVIQLRLVDGLEEKKQMAYALLSLTDSLRGLINNHSWSELQKAMFESSDNLGSRTLNQCLMNLMLKRKIDFKVGFAESPNPEELDHMLERVGV